MNSRELLPPHDDAAKRIELWLKLITFILGALLVVVVCLVLQALKGILIPFCIALLLVYLNEPLQKLLIGMRVPTKTRITLVLLCSALVLFAIGQLVYSSASALTTNLPRYEHRLLLLMDQAIQVFAIPSDQAKAFLNDFRWSQHIQPGTVATYLGQGFGSFLGFLSNGFMVLLYMVYLLFEREMFFRRIQKSFGQEDSDRLVPILFRINQQIVNYLDIKTGLSLLTGGLVTVLLFVFGVDFALFWGILTFLLNFIPAIGSIIATIPPVVVAFLQFETLNIPIAVCITLFLVQMIIGNVVEPKVMGSHLGLSPLMVILSLIFWGWLWGPIGMVLSVPILSGIRIVSENIEMLKPLSKLLAEQDL